MTSASIHRLEPFDRFMQRAIDLNALYSPDDPLHEQLVAVQPVATKPLDAPAEAIGSWTEVSWARKCLVTIHREFPFGAPVHEQAAYAVRAFAGLRVFAEANFRTGWDYTAELIEHAGRTLEAGVRDAEELGNELLDRMNQAYPTGFSRAMVLERDDVFDFLAEWFRRRVA